MGLPAVRETDDFADVSYCVDVGSARMKERPGAFCLPLCCCLVCCFAFRFAAAFASVAFVCKFAVLPLC